VGPIRSVLLRHPLLVLAIGLAALSLRLAVPAGFMPVLDSGGPALTLCSGQATAPGMAHHEQDGPKADSGCAFADLALPMIRGADPVLLAAALLVILAAGLFHAAALPSGAALRLRPPLRAPPLPR
jgi:hypothetical protein